MLLPCLTRTHPHHPHTHLYTHTQASKPALYPTHTTRHKPTPTPTPLHHPPIHPHLPTHKHTRPISYPYNQTQAHTHPPSPPTLALTPSPSPPTHPHLPTHMHPQPPAPAPPPPAVLRSVNCPAASRNAHTAQEEARLERLRRVAEKKRIWNPNQVVTNFFTPLFCKVVNPVQENYVMGYQYFSALPPYFTPVPL